MGSVFGLIIISYTIAIAIILIAYEIKEKIENKISKKDHEEFLAELKKEAELRHWIKNGYMTDEELAECLAEVNTITQRN